MKKICSLGVLCLFAALTAAAQTKIVYINGPSFAVPGYYDNVSLDMDGDGIADFNFFAGPTILFFNYYLHATVKALGSVAAGDLPSSWHCYSRMMMRETPAASAVEVQEAQA